MSINGVALLEQKSIPNTNSWSSFESIILGEVTLESGSHTVKVDAGGGSYNLDYIELLPIAK